MAGLALSISSTARARVLGFDLGGAGVIDARLEPPVAAQGQQNEDEAVVGVDRKGPAFLSRVGAERRNVMGQELVAQPDSETLPPHRRVA